MSDEQSTQSQDDRNKPPGERWSLFDWIFLGAEGIVWAVVGVVRLMAWMVAGILSSCS